MQRHTTKPINNPRKRVEKFARVKIRINSAVLARIKAEAAEKGIHYQALFRFIMSDFMQQKDRMTSADVKKLVAEYSPLA